MKKYKGIIFDLDGTLLNTIEDLTDSVNDVMEIYHFPKHDTKACKMMVGNGFRKLITRALPIEKQKDEQFIDEVQAEFAKAYHKRYLNKTVPYDGILEMIKELECNGVQTAVNSNKRSDYTEALVKKFFADIPMADAELEAADFTRDEVKEGVQELLKIYDQENFGTIFR